MVKKSGEKKWRKKVTEKTKQNYITILEAMQPDRWYKASELEESVEVKVSRIKVLLKEMTEQGLIESMGNTKGKRYKKR